MLLSRLELTPDCTMSREQESLGNEEGPGNTATE